MTPIQKRKFSLNKGKQYLVLNHCIVLILKDLSINKAQNKKKKQKIMRKVIVKKRKKKRIQNQADRLS